MSSIDLAMGYCHISEQKVKIIRNGQKMILFHVGIIQIMRIHGSTCFGKHMGDTCAIEIQIYL